METILIVLNFLTLAAVSAYAVRRMGQIEARAKTDLETMRSYYENKIKELQNCSVYLLTRSTRI